MIFEVFLVILVSGCITNAGKLPENIKTCKQRTPDFNDCLKANVQDALVQMKDGIKSLAIGPLDPLAIQGFEVGGGDGPVNIRQIFKDLALTGLVDNKIMKYEFDLDNYRIYTEAISPMIQIVGDYEMTGRILVIPVQGKGKCNITMVNLKTTHVLQGEPFEKKGKKYWRLNDYKLTLEPELVTMYFGNLFNGDRLLGESTNTFINEQWRDIFGELRPGYEETFGIIFKDIANRIFTRVPFNDIFNE